ncbi:MAG: helix-turn-helix transcriptional regulator [Acinetobacter sp.]
MSYEKGFFPLDGQLFTQQLATLIKQKRLERQLRQNDLAQAVSTSLSTIKRIERADTSVEFGVIVKVLWYLNLLTGLQKNLPIVENKINLKSRVRLQQIDEEDF